MPAYENLVVRLILFDIDGTLLWGQGMGYRSMERAGRRLLGDAFSLEGIDFSGALDPWIFAEAVARLGADHSADLGERFRAEYLVELRAEIEAGRTRPVLLPGVEGLLREMTGRERLTLGLVTGNYADAAPMKLRAAGLDPTVFTVGAFGDHAATRPELVALALERWGASGAEPDPERALVVGDTPRDVDCAHKNGVRCLAVATGRFSVEELTAAGADYVAPDLSDARVLIDLLD